LDENGDLLSFEQLKLKYNIKTTCIDVVRLHKAIPPKWLYTIESEVTYIGAGPSITPDVQFSVLQKAVNYSTINSIIPKLILL
jgi:hypothetical protein